MSYENFPTPAEIAPETTPPLDEKWVELIMGEIAALIRNKKPELQDRKIVRFTPITRRDMGHAADQWKYYAKHIADLVREHGWTAYLLAKIDGDFSTLTISAPRDGDAQTHKEVLGD